MAGEKKTTTACPVCRFSSDDYHVPAGGYRIFKCSRCGLEYTDPVPSVEELDAFYASYSDIRADVEVLERNAMRNRDLLRQNGIIDDSSMILDYGCGSGVFARIMGSRCLGYDISAEKGKTPENVTSSYCEVCKERYDVVTLWGVLEHLPDPVGSLQEIVRLISNGGHVVITTVNAEGIIPYYYKPVEHLTYWTEKAIRALLAQTGLTLQTIMPYEMEQRSDIYVNRLLSRTPEPYAKVLSGAVSGLPDFVVVPTNEFMCIAKMP